MPVRVSSSSSEVYLTFSDKSAHKSSVAFVHDLKTESSTIKNISPSRNYIVLTIKKGLVEIKTVALDP